MYYRPKKTTNIISFIDNKQETHIHWLVQQQETHIHWLILVKNNLNTIAFSTITVILSNFNHCFGNILASHYI